MYKVENMEYIINNKTLKPKPRRYIMSVHGITCDICKHLREDEDTGKKYCVLYPEDDIENKPPHYTFESFRGTGYPDYFCSDCEDVEPYKDGE
jgi:hypothetical protein